MAPGRRAGSASNDLQVVAEEGYAGKAVLDGDLHLTETTTRMEQMTFMNKWVVQQFSVQQELRLPGDFIEGSVFGGSNYKFQMKLFPSGKDDDCTGYLSLYVLISECPSSRLSFRVNFSIETLDGPKGCALNRNVVTINRGGIVTASKFFSLDSLKAKKDRYTPDDTLTVVAEITVYGELKHSRSEVDSLEELGLSSRPTLSDPQSEGHSASSSVLCPPSVSPMMTSSDRKRKSITSEQGTVAMSQDEIDGGLLGMYQSGVLSDFTILCGDREFNVHKSVLYARSGYFQIDDALDALNFLFNPENQMYTGFFNSAKNLQAEHDDEVKFDDIDDDALDACLTFMYSLSCPKLKTMPCEIAKVADRLLMPGLKNRCEMVLSGDLVLSNVIERAKVAYELEMHYLFKKCTAFFAKHREAVCQTEAWCDFRVKDSSAASFLLEKAWGLADNHKQVGMKRRRSEDV